MSKIRVVGTPPLLDDVLDELQAAGWPGRDLVVEIRRTETRGVEAAEIQGTLEEREREEHHRIRRILRDRRGALRRS